MASEVDDDLLTILLNRRLNIEIRLTAWEYVLSLTASEDGLKRLTSYKKYGAFFFAYLAAPWAEKETLHLAFKCLISLSSTGPGASFLMNAKENLIEYLLKDIASASSNFIVDKCYVLSNISQHFDVLSRAKSTFKDLWKTSLRSSFCFLEKEVRDKYVFLSFVFSNISRTSEGRKFFIEDESFLNTFIQGLNPEESATKRLGMALTIRNLCSATIYHKKLLEDYNILPVLLLPLMDSEEYEEEDMEKLPLECQYLDDSKEREMLPQIRKSLVQALSLLCYSEESWKHLKEKGVYVVARSLHTWETDPGVIEAIETLVGFLLVENYDESESLQTVKPAETDVLQDIPDVVLC